jgi:hypothetical protein
LTLPSSSFWNGADGEEKGGVNTKDRDPIRERDLITGYVNVIYNE